MVFDNNLAVFQKMKEIQQKLSKAKDSAEVAEILKNDIREVVEQEKKLSQNTAANQLAKMQNDLGIEMTVDLALHRTDSELAEVLKDEAKDMLESDNLSQILVIRKWNSIIFRLWKSIHCNWS